MQSDRITEQFTRHVALVLDNDEGLYRYRLELVAVARRDAEDSWLRLAEDDARFKLADLLKDWCEELAGLEDDTLPMMAREMLALALAYADWQGLAADYLAEEA